MKTDLTRAQERLYGRRTFGVKLGLHVEQALLERLGSPEQTFAAIHIAGTNGKGSTGAMIEAILRQTGLRVGFYTSPHLVRFNERFRVGGRDISDAALAHLIDETDAVSEAVTEEEGQEPTFFEISTAIAFKHFANEHVQVGVVETGLGGRLDATNVVHPLVSVITRIGLDHTAYLGDTVEEIASEKAGIIKPGRPVVCGAMDEAARDVIRSAAAEKGCRFVDVSDCVSLDAMGHSGAGWRVHVQSANMDYGRLQLSLAGAHQLENLATAVAAVETVAALTGVPVTPEAVKQGLLDVVWPGRGQIIEESPLRLLDGAHNAMGAAALAVWLKNIAGRRPVGLVLGMCGDKDLQGFLAPLSGIVRRAWTVTIQNERAVPAETLARAAVSMGWMPEACDLSSALAASRSWALEEDGVVCIAGSLFLVGEVLALEGEGVDRNG